MSLLGYFGIRKNLRKPPFRDGGVSQSRQFSFTPDERSAWEVRKKLERILTENIVPFWYPNILDKIDGGYRLNHDLEGTWQGVGNKFLIAQTRTLWFFSRLSHSRYGSRQYLNAAAHGYEFLRRRMWDEKFGGFYWEVDAPGHTPTRPEKQMYGQAFGLYALTEYARASGESSAEALAKELFSLLESKAHDGRHGGYADVLQRDWTPECPMTRPVGKRMNTHLHLLEALTTFLAMTGEAAARERLLELILINGNSVVRKTVGACSEMHLENWQPLTGPAFDRASYGHDLENIWLLLEAGKVAGISPSLMLDLFRTLFAYSLRYGFDRKEGGFYDGGSFDAPADRRRKIWWVQAEALVAALQMYRLTGGQEYWECFARTLDWVVARQIDWDRGEWYEVIEVDGTASGVKAGPWKCPYHNGRAMLRCLELLAESAPAI